MAKWGDVDYKELLELQKRVEKLIEQSDALMEACAKDIAKRLIALTVKATPVGHYPSGSGKVGGTLRRGWTANGLTVTRAGRQYTVTIYNRTEYASYVEYGHRTRGGKGWVKGRYMLTGSIEEIENKLDGIIEAKIMKWLKECFK